MLFTLVGCGTTRSEQPGTASRQQVELQNLNTTLDLVRKSLADMADERDRFQDLYLTATSELAQRRGDVEYLEARYRTELQSRTGARAEVSRLERELDVAKHAREQLQTVVDNLQATKDRERERLASANEGRERLERSLVDLQATRTRLQADLDAALAERDQFRSELDEIARQMASGTASAELTLASQNRELTELRHEVEVLRPLRQQVEDLRERLSDTDQARREEMAIRVDLEKRVQSADRGEPVEVSASALPSAFEYVSRYSNRSISKLRRGEFDRGSITFAVVAGALLCLSMYVVFTWFRLRTWRGRAKQMQRELATAQGQRRQSGAPTPPGPRQFSVPPELVRQRPSSAGSERPAQPAPPAPAPQPAPVAAAPRPAPRPASPAMPSEAATQIVGGRPEVEEWNSAVTEDLSDLVRGNMSSSSGRGTSEEDQLLEDLRNVINDKFSS